MKKPQFKVIFTNGCANEAQTKRINISFSTLKKKKKNNLTFGRIKKYKYVYRDVDSINVTMKIVTSLIKLDANYCKKFSITM